MGKFFGFGYIIKEHKNLPIKAGFLTEKKINVNFIKLYHKSGTNSATSIQERFYTELLALFFIKVKIF